MDHEDRIRWVFFILALAIGLALGGALQANLTARVMELERQMHLVPDAAILLIDAMPRGAVNLDPESPANKRLIEYLKPRKASDPCIVALAVHVAKTRKAAFEQERGANAEELSRAYDLFKECMK